MKSLYLLLLCFGLFGPSFGQSYPKFEKILTKELHKESRKDGRWVFYPDKADITKVEIPLVKSSFPNYDVFQVILTNYLGWHINQGVCTVLFDSVLSKIILIEPLWYGDISEACVRLFIGRKFASKDSLMNCLQGMHELMQIGSGYKFRHLSASDSLITYDLGYFKGDTYYTEGNGTSSTVRYNKEGIWRTIKIAIEDLKIVRYTSINPKTNDKEVIE